MIYFKTFANCFLVRGATRSLVCDLQRQASDFVPNDLIDVMEMLNGKNSVEKVLLHYGEENKGVIQGYLDYMDEKEYGFYCEEDEFDLFPELNKEFLVPAHITNTILELKKENIGWFQELVPQIEDLGCKDVVLVFYEELSEKDFNRIFEYFVDTRIKSFEITSKYHKEINEDFLNKINRKLNQLTKVIFFSAPEDKAEFWDNKILYDRFFTKKEIKSFKACGVVDTKYFNTNLPKVLEAINHNSCLNMKMAVDKNGDIRNCPAMPLSYGNIKDTTLEEALNKKGFKKYWDLTKDEIEVCKDCEFRYICTDCRAFTERTHKNKDGLDTSKPLKCGYDPYTGKWEEWSTNPLKQKAIDYYGLKGITKK